MNQPKRKNMKNLFTRKTPIQPVSGTVEFVYDKNTKKNNKFSYALLPSNKTRAIALKKQKELEDISKSSNSSFYEVIISEKVVYGSRYGSDTKLVEVSICDKDNYKFLKIAIKYWNKDEYQYLPTKYRVLIPIIPARKIIKKLYEYFYNENLS